MINVIDAASDSRLMNDECLAILNKVNSQIDKCSVLKIARYDQTEGVLVEGNAGKLKQIYVIINELLSNPYSPDDFIMKLTNGRDYIYSGEVSIDSKTYFIFKII